MLMHDNRITTMQQYALSDSGDEFISFENITGWTGIVGTVEADLVNHEYGTQSIKFTTAVGTKAEALIPLNLSLGSAVPTIRFFVHIDDYSNWYANLSSIRFYIYDTDNAYASYTFTPGSRVIAYFHETGFTSFELLPEHWDTTTGGNDFNKTQTKILIRLTPKADTQISMSFDYSVINPFRTPAVLFTFDDASESIYTYAYPKLKEYGAKGTHYIITDDVGSSPQISVEQLQEMYNYGWSISNHTVDHTNLTTVDEATATQKITDCKTALDGWGFTRSSVHLSYPFGSTNATTISASITSGMLTGRITNASGTNLLLPEHNYYLLIENELGTSSSLAQAKASVDLAVSTGRVVVFYGHVLAEAQASSTWAIADFNELVDYVHSKRMPILTINDFYDLQSGAKRVKAY